MGGEGGGIPHLRINPIYPSEKLVPNVEGQAVIGGDSNS